MDATDLTYAAPAGGGETLWRLTLTGLVQGDGPEIPYAGITAIHMEFGQRRQVSVFTHVTVTAPGNPRARISNPSQPKGAADLTAAHLVFVMDLIGRARAARPDVAVTTGLSRPMWLGWIVGMVLFGIGVGLALMIILGSLMTLNWEGGLSGLLIGAVCLQMVLMCWRSVQQGKVQPFEG